MSYTHRVERNVVTRFNVGDVLLNQLGEERTVKKVFMGEDNVLRYEWEEGTHGFVYIVDEKWEAAPEKPTHTTFITIDQYGPGWAMDATIPDDLVAAYESMIRESFRWSDTKVDITIDWGHPTKRGKPTKRSVGR